MSERSDFGEGDGDGSTLGVVDPDADAASDGAVGDDVDLAQAFLAGEGDDGSAGGEHAGGEGGVILGLLGGSHGVGENEEIFGGVIVGEAGAVVVEGAADDEVVRIAAAELIAGVFPADAQTGEVGGFELLKSHGKKSMVDREESERSDFVVDSETNQSS